ncbi:MAG TPA: DoxX family protein [Modestobacter sp.]|nr:DoxX family protein [Modestobacter sp.]
MDRHRAARRRLRRGGPHDAQPAEAGPGDDRSGLGRGRPRRRRQGNRRLEVLGAVGLLLPALLDTATVLGPLAAVGLAVLMVGPAVTRARRREYPNIAVNLVLAALAVFIAVQRFGPHAC